jgi:hypothetical protein
MRASLFALPLVRGWVDSRVIAHARMRIVSLSFAWIVYLTLLVGLVRLRRLIRRVHAVRVLSQVALHQYVMYLLDA